MRLHGVLAFIAGLAIAAAAHATDIDAWREDLAVARTEFLERDKSFSPEARRRYRDEITALEAMLGRVSEEEIVVRLARAVALADNPHTRLYILRNRTELRRYPLRLWWFGAELRVVRVLPGLEKLLGARVTRMAGVPVEELRRQVAPLFAGTETWREYMSTYSMTSPEILIGLGRVGRDARLAIDYVAMDGGVGRETVDPMPLRKVAGPTESWWDLAPGRPRAEAGWAQVLAARGTRVPPYLQQTEQGYWSRYLEADRIYYVQYSRADNAPGREPLAQFSRAMLADMAKVPARAVVVDLRFNTGGNLYVGHPALAELAAHAKERGIALYALVSRTTFSAGIYHAMQLRAAGARVVGEPMGDRLQFWAEGGNVVMPRSGLSLHFADRFHNYAREDRPEFDDLLFRDSRLRVESSMPDVIVSPTWRQYLAGEDPMLDAVRNEMAAAPRR
ncbi:MAG TPA: hypothetical protein VM122_00070 [Usitatibacter sp.]|nr:hypothetical protein [Usitatibacter sp.]